VPAGPHGFLIPNPKSHFCDAETPSLNHIVMFVSQRKSEGANLGLLVGKDIGVTSVEDGHGAATEELTAGGTELDLYGRANV